MPQPVRSSQYCAYLLRCWHANSHADTDIHGWRFSLEDPHTGARHSFASFDALLAFLRDTLRSDPGARSNAHGDQERM